MGLSRAHSGPPPPSPYGRGRAQVGRGGEVGDYRILTPERVTLQYDIAGIGSRSAAALIDVTIQGLMLTVVLILGVAGSGQLSRLGLVDARPVGGAILLALVVLLVALILWGYYFVFEIIWSGQTPGKRLLGLRVIRESGFPIRPVDAAIRNLVRVIDGPPLAYAIGLLVMLLNERAKRLGDFAAGTIVVREGARRSLSAVTAVAAVAVSEAAETAGADAAGIPVLDPQDATLVRDFLVRRAHLAPEARSRLAARLATRLAARYGIQGQRDGLADEAFLERLGSR